MDLDAAITYMAERNDSVFDFYPEEYQQMETWLRELKESREKIKQLEKFNSVKLSKLEKKNKELLQATKSAQETLDNHDKGLETICDYLGRLIENKDMDEDERLMYLKQLVELLQHKLKK